MDSSISPNTFDATLSFAREPNILACGYWKSCCDGRAMPSRADLNPVAMKKFTPHIGLVEVRPQHNGITYFIRRAGMRWEEVYGAMTGKFITDFLPPHVVASWHEIFGEVLATKAPTRLISRVDFKNKRWLAVEQLIAPLGEQDDITMLFVSFVAWSHSASSAVHNSASH